MFDGFIDELNGASGIIDFIHEIFVIFDFNGLKSGVCDDRVDECGIEEIKDGIELESV